MTIYIDKYNAEGVTIHDVESKEDICIGNEFLRIRKKSNEKNNKVNYHITYIPIRDIQEMRIDYTVKKAQE